MHSKSEGRRNDMRWSWKHVWFEIFNFIFIITFSFPCRKNIGLSKVKSSNVFKGRFQIRWGRISRTCSGRFFKHQSCWVLLHHFNEGYQLSLFCIFLGVAAGISPALRLARPWPTLVAHELPRAHLPLAALRQACIHLYSTVPNYRIENIWLEETAGILQSKPSHWGKLINLVLKIPKKTLRTEKECQKIISGNLVLVSRNCFFQNSVLISNDTLR